MIEKLRITSKLVGDTELVCKSLIGNIWWVLTENTFRLVKASELESNPIFKDEKPLVIRFGRMNKTWELEYDTEDKPHVPYSRKSGEDDERYLHEQTKLANEINRNKRIAVKEFFARNNQLEHGSEFDNGFTPSGPILGVVEVVTQKAKMRHLADRKKAHVFNLIDSMSWQEQYDLTLYYCPEMAGKRRSECLHALIGLKDVGTERAHLGGRMWQKTDNGRALIADDFLNNYVNHRSNTIVMKINIEKAIVHHIITRGAGGLYLGTTHIGKDTTDAVIHFSKDMVTYTNQLLSELAKFGELPEDDLETEPKIEAPLKTTYEKNKQVNLSSQEWKDEYERLKDEYTKNGGSWPNTGLSLKELRERVEKQRVALQAVAKMEDLPSVQLEQEVDPLATDDMKKLAALGKEYGVKMANQYKSPTALKEAIKAKMKEKEGVTTE